MIRTNPVDKRDGFNFSDCKRPVTGEVRGARVQVKQKNVK